MNDISGLFSGSLSPSWRLQLSLASRLRHRLVVGGLPMFDVSWKRWDMPSGPPIFRLRLSVRPICVIGSGGAQCVWPTPRTSDGNGAGRHGKGGPDLRTVVLWATPTARDWKDGARLGSLPVNGLLGRQVLTGSNTPGGGPVPTGSFGRLNPAFSLWLMGFPAEWLQYVPRGMQSFRRSGQFS